MNITTIANANKDTNIVDVVLEPNPTSEAAAADVGCPWEEVVPLGAFALVVEDMWVVDGSRGISVGTQVDLVGAGTFCLLP